MMPLVAKAVLQLQIVFNDAVVNNHETAGVVGMSINFRGTPVGRPAGMADARLSSQRLFCQVFFQVDQFAFSTADANLALTDRGDPCRIVTTIFETL